MHNSPFTVAGMSGTSTSTHHSSPNLHSWGSTSMNGPLTTSFSDSLSQSRSHYQPGYLMSSQRDNSPQGNQRPDETPIVQTKAKMNQILSRGSTSDFGMDSMFESTRRQRQKLADEDAPPTSSVNDIPNEMNFDSSSPTRFQPKNSPFSPTFLRRPQQTSSPQQQPSSHQHQGPLYVVVFGYPIDKYSLTVEYFQSFGSSTEPDLNHEITNCFRIGYYDPTDAMRAVRKNGEVLGGSWMVGTKWADPAQVELILGHTFPSPPIFSSGGPLPDSQPMSMSVDSPQQQQQQQQSQTHPSTPTVGTPIKLAPSASAFRRKVPGGGTPDQRQQPVGGWGPVAPLAAQEPGQGGTGVGLGLGLGVGGTQTPPSKGVLGQVSDLIFGW